MNFAMLGPGRIADTQLAPALAKTGGARLWSVLSRDEQRGRAFAERHGAAAAKPVHTDLNSLLSTELNHGTDGKKWGDDGTYLSVGNYLEQIERFQELFRQDVLIISFSELIRYPDQAFAKIGRFLDLETGELHLEHENSYALPKNWFAKKLLSIGYLRFVGRKLFPPTFRGVLHKSMLSPAQKPELDKDTESFLEDYYRSEITTLENRFKLDLSL